MDYKVEKDYWIDDYRCIVIGVHLGHRCGYVGLPKEHKYKVKDAMDSNELAVHGGITYSAKSTKENPYPADDGRWYIGFDCGHHMDGKDIELIRELNDESSAKSLIELEEMFPLNYIVRDIQYVEKELESLVEQLKKIDEKDESTTINKYKKKPVVIEAIQFKYGVNECECLEFCDDMSYDIDFSYYIIKTLEGNMEVSDRDYIIKGVKDEYYPCKPDIFKMTYEKDDE